MSIIHDALKKTQANLDKMSAQDSVDANDADITLPPTPKKTREGSSGRGKFWLKAIVIILGVNLLIVGGIFAAAFLKTNKMAANTEETKEAPELPKAFQVLKDLKDKKAAQSAAPASAAKAAPIKSSPAKIAKNDGYNAPLVLKGIMKMGNTQVALINDKMYEAGEYVDGMQITKITMQSVELNDKGETITLRTK